MACAKTARIEPFTFSVRENSAITVADNPSIVFQPKAIKSISAMSDTTLKRVIKSVNGARTVSDLMKAVEMPWCFQNEDIDTTAKRSVAIDRQTARPQNQVNPGSSTMNPGTKSTVSERRRSKIPQCSVNPSRMTDRKRDSVSILQGGESGLGRRRLFVPQNSRHTSKAHKIITIDPVSHQRSQPTTSAMMMQQPIGHDFPYYEHSTGSHSRPKSASIEITRPRGYDNSAALLDSSSAERMYDWATWRMYHRITTARRSRASVVPFNNGMAATSTSGNGKNKDQMNLLDDSSSSQTPSLASPDYELEGEVFDFEI